VLTKHESAENMLKYQLSIEDPIVGLDIDKLVEKNIASLCTQQVYPEDKPKIKTTRAKKALPKKSKLSRITQRLYNLESENEPEKPLNIELYLYQMETY